MSNNTFQQDWGFPSEVKATIPGATWFEVQPVPGNYRSGRPKFECTFAGGGKVLATRPAMELTSKKTGKPYHVCRREADSWPSASAQPKPASRPTAAAQFSLDDVLDEIA